MVLKFFFPKTKTHGAGGDRAYPGLDPSEWIQILETQSEL
jgi:hypothetical protein